MGEVKTRGHIDGTSGTASDLFTFFYFTSITLSVPIPEIQLFKNLTSKTKVQDIGVVKGGGHIADPESNQCNSFLFYVNRNKHSKDMVNRMFVPERTYPKLKKKKPKKKKKKFPTELLHNSISSDALLQEYSYRVL